MPVWRICPHCGLRTDDASCPDDGVDTQRIQADTRFPGRLNNGHMLRDQYRVEQLVGVGGMGAVYKAVHNITRQPVAVKVLWRDLADNPQEVKRFTREARAASILTHPNTVRVFDFGRDDRSGAIYMVMEFLEGRKLSDALTETPVMPPVRAVHIAAQVCKSLEEAHSKGIVHRDLKPDNIFLQEVAGEKDFVKVLDFGLAKFVAGDFERDNLTKTGYVVGSPEYMAPEQAIGSNVGPSADLYSLGIVLYEILTGDLPFDAATTAQVLRKHIMDRVPDMPTEIRGNIPPRLEAVVLRCLEKDPTDRPPSAEVLRIQLLQAQDRRRRSRDPSQPIVLDEAPAVDTQEVQRPATVAVEAPGAVAGAVIFPDGTGADLSPREPTPVVSLASSPAVDTDQVSRGMAQGAGGADGKTLRSAPTSSPTKNDREPESAAASARRRELAREVTAGLPDDVDTAALRRLVEDDGDSPLSGWMLVAIGTAAAVGVVLAALLLR